MNDSLAHRGPDAEGHYADGHCTLVHRRLKILDLSPAGAQPMASDDGEVVIAFNGEIYNHHQLRRELEAAKAGVEQVEQGRETAEARADEE